MTSFSERMCVICRGKEDKSTLIRLVYSNGSIVVDRNHDLPGRGAYLHRTWECWSRLGNPSKWARALRIEGVPDLKDVFSEIRDMLDPELGPPSTALQAPSKGVRSRQAKGEKSAKGRKDIVLGVPKGTTTAK